MDCDWLTHNTGYECRSVRRLDSDESALEVDAPFSFSDGEVIGFYIIDCGDTIKISDNGDTLAHLSSMGLSLDASQLRSIRERLTPHDIFLSELGEIYTTGNTASLPEVMARYITGLLSITTYEREALVTTEIAAQ